ncbi:hypothetical protein MHO82_13545 [Vibrio sp. Of7-15]|uniref:hypothetical protein n=1 Tax=Vibrio sp. Of7-15 TaxID=2724879 RepID=UPI001EF3433F|nr:hypothetical protein [Vibrio sp. Of7-15]MCG7497889.1 hypothetical protein [Vibrio sp. Of7-15]
MKLSLFKGFLALIVLSASSPALAKGERYGASFQQLSFDGTTIDAGETGSGDVLRFGLVHTRPIDENSNRWRWWFGLNYLATDIEAPKNGVYQEVSNLEFRLVPQYAFGTLEWLTPYIGVGLSAGYSQYSNRFPVDSDGFKYGDQLEDESKFEFGAVFNLGTVIKIGSNPDAHLQLIPNVSYIQPMNDGLGGIELSFALLF